MRLSRSSTAPIVATLACMAFALCTVWLIGSAALPRRDVDPRLLRTGAVFAYLRDGESFSLAQAYPDKWDIARFAPSALSLDRREQSQLYAYDSRYADADDEPLILLKYDGELVEVIRFSDSKKGYPRFVDTMGSRDFSLSREEAVFMCSFLYDDNEGGYYECREVDGHESVARYAFLNAKAVCSAAVIRA